MKFRLDDIGQGMLGAALIAAILSFIVSAIL